MKHGKTVIRILALVMCAVLSLGCLVACGNEIERGAVVNIYLGAEMRSWDPAIGFTDAAAVKYFSLVSEGLMGYDQKGKVDLLGCKEVVTRTDVNGDLVLTFKLIGSWSDGRPVSANDYIYSFKRILDPDFTSPAKSLLYPIKNARAILKGECGIDDLCIYAPNTTTLEIVMQEPDADLDAFYENLCSMALVPIREDMVDVYDEWDYTAIDIITNGPFNVKTMDSEKEGGELVLERNKFYTEISHNVFLSDDVKSKFITPYQLVIRYGAKYADREAAYDYDFSKDGEIKTESGAKLTAATDQIMMLSGINGDSELSKIKSHDLMSTYSYYFNTKNKLFAKAEVRQALSMAIDRTALAALYYDANPATGLIPNGVNYATYKDSFREEAGDILTVTGDVDGAKALLKKAGVTKGSFTLTYRDVNRNGEIAEMVQKVWESLGFKVKLEGLEYNDYMKKMNLYVEGVSNLIKEQVFEDDGTVMTDGNGNAVFKYYLVDENGKKTEIEEDTDYSLKTKDEEPESHYDFDVIGLDFQALTANAMYSLCQFAPDYSGNAMMTQYSDYGARTHMTGYNSKDFNALIDQAFAAKTREEAATALKDAEKILMTDLPVCPLIFNADSYVASSKLSKYETKSGYGILNFSKMKLRSFVDYQPESAKAVEATTEAN